MSFYAKVRKADDLVVGLSVLDPSQAVKFPLDADVSLIEITEAQHTTASAGLFYDGSDIPKFAWTGTAFAVNPDLRPVVTFTPDRIKAEIGEVVTVQIDHSGGLDGTKEFDLAGVPMRVDFTAGNATVTIDTDRPGDFQVGPQQAFSVAAPLLVTVYARKLGTQL